MKKIYLLQTKKGRYCSKRFSSKKAAEEYVNCFNEPYQEYTIVAKNTYWVTICDEYNYLRYTFEDILFYFKNMINAMIDCIWTLFVFIFRIVFLPFILIFRHKKTLKKLIDKE